MTDAQKDWLREINAKFAIVGKSQLFYKVEEGEQTKNFKLD